MAVMHEDRPVLVFGRLALVAPRTWVSHAPLPVTEMQQNLAAWPTVARAADTALVYHRRDDRGDYLVSTTWGFGTAATYDRFYVRNMSEEKGGTLVTVEQRVSPLLTLLVVSGELFALAAGAFGLYVVLAHGDWAGLILLAFPVMAWVGVSTCRNEAATCCGELLRGGLQRAP